MVRTVVNCCTVTFVAYRVDLNFREVSWRKVCHVNIMLQIFINLFKKSRMPFIFNGKTLLLNLSLSLFCLSGLSACSIPTLGPKSIAPSRMSYNDAISSSWDEQLLLNLVRVRYAESPLFVDITAINASMGMSSSASLGGTMLGAGGSDLSSGLGMEYRDSPVISYNYLQGEAFAKHVLTPLTPNIIEPLTRSGWSSERLLLCCIETINGIDNDVPDRERFGRVADLMGELQTARELRINADSSGKITLFIKSRGPMGMELRNLLGLSPELDRYEVLDGIQFGPTTVALQGRSVLAVFHGLAFAVNVPPEDAGKVIQLSNSKGEPVDSKLLTSQLLNVNSGPVAPNNAQVKVKVRDHWFWVDSTDLNSKLTLSLLRMLLFIKSVDRPAHQPVLTIPAN